ncbi:MAG: 5'-nucleotidase [Oceanospirillales bacterium]|nr:5'-nucleotidase [Oceanospirillales bacterium]
MSAKKGITFRCPTRSKTSSLLQLPPALCLISASLIAFSGARNAPSHERVITTLEHWGVDANEVFFLGGMKKDRILNVLKPHMFFNDQRSHLESDAGDIPMVHIPFGVANVDA